MNAMVSQAAKARFLLRLLVCAAAFVAGQALAQGWPAKPLKLIVENAPGTAPDLIARRLADLLGRAIGQPVVVENVSGAGGLIASQAAARAAPDGYTLFFGTTGALITNRYTAKAPLYDPDRDFALISRIYEEGSLGIAVTPELPARNLSELIALAKAQPGKLSYGTPSVALLMLFGRWLQKVAGIEMLAVAYKSNAQELQDLIAGRIQVMIASPADLERFHRAGKLRVIAVDGSKPNPLLPGVPNIIETLPSFRMSGVGVLVAPAATPPEILQRLNQVMDRVVRDPEYVRTLNGIGFTINGAGTPQSIAEFLRERRTYWDNVMKTLGVQPE